MLSKRMPSSAEMAREWDDINESYVSEVVYEPVNQVTSRLANIQRRVEEANDAIDDVGKGTGKRDSDMKGMETRFC